MARWKQRNIPLKPDHGWSATPGYHVFVADRGAVRFDFPKGWLIIPTDTGSIKIHDKPPPGDDAVLQMTVSYLARGMDWNILDLPKLLHDLMAKETREILWKGEVVRVRRPGLDLIWTITRFRDEGTRREAFSRTAIAREKEIQPLFTFDYWVEEHPRMSQVWDVFLRTLRLAHYIADPSVGDVRHKRN